MIPSTGLSRYRSFLDTSGPPGRYLDLERHRAGGTAVDVASWLRDLGLERYEAAFRENDVGAELLSNLTADDLKELGVTLVGHRRHLLEAIAALRLEARRPVIPSGFARHPPISPPTTSTRPRPPPNAARSA